MKFTNFLKGASREQTKDFGMVVTLVLLATAWYTKEKWPLQAAFIILLINIIYPPVYRTFASAWLNLSLLLGNVVSKLLLSLIFAVLVIPVGVLRRAFGFDSLSLRKWKKDGSSTFTVREHTYGPEDLEKPY